MKVLLNALWSYARTRTATRQVIVRFNSHSSIDAGPHYCLGTCSKALRERQYRPRRAVLYVPGNDERKLLKIPFLNVDCAVMDCEDGVALNRKVRLLTLLLLRPNHDFNFYHSLGYSADKLLTFCSYFPQNTGFNILCKLSLLETVSMKCQNLFLGKIRKIFKNVLLYFLFHPENIYCGYH